MKGHNYGLCRKCGKFHTHPTANPSVRESISRALKGRKLSPEWRKHISLARLGKTYPNLSKAHLGQHYPKLSEAKLGLPRIKPCIEASACLSYILGVMKGDGCAYNGYTKHKRGIITLRVTKPSFAEKFQLELGKIGLNPNLHIPDNHFYNVYAYSIAFVDWYQSLTLFDIGKLISGYEREFLCGFYESEGHLANYYRPHLNHQHHIFQISIGNSDKALIELCYNLLCRLDFHPTIRVADKSKWGYKTQYSVNLCRHAEVKRFLKVTKPCIKGG